MEDTTLSFDFSTFDWAIAAATFAAYLAVDALYAIYTIEVVRLRPARAATTGALIYVLSAFGIVNLVHNALYIIPLALGGWLGTFFSGRLIGWLGLGRYLIGGCTVVALGLLGFTLAPTFIALIAALFVVSLGSSTFNAGLNLFVAAQYSTGRLSWRCVPTAAQTRLASR